MYSYTAAHPARPAHPTLSLLSLGRAGGRQLRPTLPLLYLRTKDTGPSLQNARPMNEADYTLCTLSLIK